MTPGQAANAKADANVLTVEKAEEVTMDTATTPAFMIESSVALRERDTFFGRAEIVEKPAEDLHVHELPTSILTVGKLEIGYARYLAGWKGTVIGFGGAFTAAIVPDELVSRYYGHVAPGLAVFVNIRPARHPM